MNDHHAARPKYQSEKGKYSNVSGVISSIFDKTWQQGDMTWNSPTDVSEVSNMLSLDINMRIYVSRVTGYASVRQSNVLRNNIQFYLHVLILQFVYQQPSKYVRFVIID